MVLYGDVPTFLYTWYIQILCPDPRTHASHPGSGGVSYVANIHAQNYHVLMTSHFQVILLSYKSKQNDERFMPEIIHPNESLKPIPISPPLSIIIIVNVNLKAYKHPVSHCLSKRFLHYTKLDICCQWLL